MYCVVRRDLSPTERLPVGLYGDRISMSSRDPSIPSASAKRSFRIEHRVYLKATRTQNVLHVAPIPCNRLGV